MDSEEGPSRLASSSRVEKTTIQLGDTILLRLPSGDIRTLKLEKDSTIHLGKYGSFFSTELVNQPYGLTYEIANKKLTVLPPKGLQEVEDTDATNELINDGQFVQPLTLEEIEALKKSGISASEIIKKQIEQHATYSLKTEYSKEKYKKRKEAKYSKSFSTVAPTLFNVCEYWFNKDQNRLRDVRPDSLSQILNLASIRPGGRYLAVDDASGVVIAGILERLGGSGRLITVCDVDSPPAYPVVTHMNFSKETMAVMSSLNWATADEEYTPVVPSAEPPSGSYKSDAHKSRLNKRKVASNTLMQNREELFAGEFDGLVIASQYDPLSILQKLYPYLGGSASIVVHSPQVQILSDLQGKLRDIPGYLGPAVSEPWLRRYQVLPGRTHPTMNTTGSGGFILHTIKVYDDPNASSVMAHRHKAKKPKTEDEDTPVTSNDATPAPANASPVPLPLPSDADAMMSEGGPSVFES
ncbi:tRNA (adenine(58)-N(1))-methyltransferase non-catalytic subunit trm6 [Steccherinum ochraceum]|uniref:tRNA (adenine(58)-N(1))-methyltransferase non-catalytic subunit TRM6 n=1 Tax=Steccherinum ochraceum TaxID=92696 RepID=A0A4R0RI31_9APHY|nr:tRNA (adenine(58)-N(1))-methyltransferase non-catalytic subunit trm6 [Steccherinum ochraceum]